MGRGLGVLMHVSEAMKRGGTALDRARDGRGGGGLDMADDGMQAEGYGWEAASPFPVSDCEAMMMERRFIQH